MSTSARFEKTARVLVAGADGFLGGAIHRELSLAGFSGLIPSPAEPELGSAATVTTLFDRTRPEFVFAAAGPAAGIMGNIKHPADLMAANLAVAVNLITAAHRAGTQKLLFVASSCCYPRLCPQPMGPDALLTGPLEPTNEPYALAKLAGMKLAQAYRRQHGDRFISCIPANTYGADDDLDPEQSHVISALLQRFHAARQSGKDKVVVWGSGTPRRDFLYVEDFASACVLAMESYEDEAPLNISSGVDASIAELAATIAEVVGFDGKVEFDRSRPDGMPVKRLDGQVLKRLGWKPRWSLRAGLERTYQALLTRLRGSDGGPR